MMERIGTELPELIADPDDAETNRASNEANLRLVADLLESGADPRLVELPEPTIAYTELGAHQNRALTGLMRAYRLGHEFGWRRIADILREQIDDPARYAAALELVSAWMFSYVDAATCLAEESYTRERERWLRTASASRAETISAILGGTSIDTRAAALRLGYELDRSHLALVAWLDSAEPGQDPIGTLERAVSDATRSAGVDAPLIHPLGLITVAAWVGSREPLGEAVASAIDFGADALAGVRIAAGAPGEGAAGFGRSHEEAMHARRVATLAARPPGTVTTYSSVALTAMATADLDQARTFVQRQLADLGGDDDTSLRLGATLRAYLDEGASHARAAHRLGIHENTVRYRVRQAEDLLGRPIGPGDLELRVALALAQTAPKLGSAE